MIGWQHIHQHDIMLKQYVNKQFQTLPNVKLVNPHSIYPVVTFTVNGLHSQDVANYLGHQKIIVRSGLSCAKLAHYIIDEPAVVRASF
jgi:cysteine desulfurase/selenocysteine lyase